MNIDKKLDELIENGQGYVFQHEETGHICHVEAQQVEWGFEENNPRLQKIGKYVDQSDIESLKELLKDYVLVPKEITEEVKHAVNTALNSSEFYCIKDDMITVIHKAITEATE